MKVNLNQRLLNAILILDAKKEKIRNDFFNKLQQAGIQRESFFDPVEKMNYEKLHAPTEFLFERAARMNLKMPLCDTWQRDIKSYQEKIKKQEEQKAKSQG